MFTMHGVLVTRNIYDMIATKMCADSTTVLKTKLPDGRIAYVDQNNASSVGIEGRFYKFFHFALSSGTAKVVVQDKLNKIIELFRQDAESRLFLFPEIS